MLNILTATKIEATPIIEAFSLVKTNISDEIPLYKTSQITLGISGVGFQNAKTLAERIFDKSNENAVWLNFGVAGSGSYAIGSLVQARTVTQVETGEIWKLSSNFSSILSQADVVTVHTPQVVYSNDEVYEMESAGIVTHLSTQGQLDRVVVLKLISDGPGKNAISLNKSAIQKLVHGAKNDIIAAVNHVFQCC